MPTASYRTCAHHDNRSIQPSQIWQCSLHSRKLQSNDNGNAVNSLAMFPCCLERSLSSKGVIVQYVSGQVLSSLTHPVSNVYHGCHCPVSWRADSMSHDTHPVSIVCYWSGYPISSKIHPKRITKKACPLMPCERRTYHVYYEHHSLMC